MMSSKMRRFVHLIANDLKDSYTLRNIDIGPLFADANVGTGSRVACLPRPLVRFECSGKISLMEFFHLGSKIVGVNHDRRTILFDTTTSTVRMGPDLQHGKFVDPAWAAMEGSLYLINMFPEDYGTSCFEALRFDSCIHDWSWDLLPSPPFLDMPFEIDSDIQSYGAGDGKNIWISTEGKGTYSFDITTGGWCKVGGRALPFEGRVQYIPDYNLCLGFFNQTMNLCSAELGVGAGALEPPVHQKVWDDEDIDGCIADGWYLARSHT